MTGRLAGGHRRAEGHLPQLWPDPGKLLARSGLASPARQATQSSAAGTPLAGTKAWAESGAEP